MCGKTFGVVSIQASGLRAYIKMPHLADGGDERWWMSALQMRCLPVNGCQPPVSAMLERKGRLWALTRNEYSEGTTHCLAVRLPLLEEPGVQPWHTQVQAHQLRFRS